MSDIEDLIADINAEKRVYAQRICPSASPDAIVDLLQRASDTLQAELSDDYISFLQQNDGLDFNGFVIYAATEHPEPYLSGFIEANERLADPPRIYVFYGDTGDQLYAQNRVSGAWVALDRPSLGVIAIFPCFAAMLTQVLRDAIAE